MDSFLSKLDSILSKSVEKLSKKISKISTQKSETYPQNSGLCQDIERWKNYFENHNNQREIKENIV